jgi:hypothetical protein
LIGIGLLASLAAIAWNQHVVFPERGDLIAVEGRLERIHLESFRSRTADTQWIVFDIAVEGAGEGELERWVLPDSSIQFEQPLAALEIGANVRGLLERQEQQVRGAEYPVKIVWSVEQRGKEIIPYVLVLEVERSVNLQSPFIGMMTAAIGLGFVTLGFVLRR